MAERVRLLAAGDGRSSSASLRTVAAGPRRSKSLRDFVELGESVHAPWLHGNKKGIQRGSLFYFHNGGEGEIRTHVPELPDHPISSRRRYDHFGTSPLTYFAPHDLTGLRLDDAEADQTKNTFVKSPSWSIKDYSSASATGMLHDRSAPPHGERVNDRA